MSVFRLGLPWPRIPAMHSILSSVLGFCASALRGQRTGLGLSKRDCRFTSVIHIENLYNLDGRALL